MIRNSLKRFFAQKKYQHPIRKDFVVEKEQFEKDGQIYERLNVVQDVPENRGKMFKFSDFSLNNRVALGQVVGMSPASFGAPSTAIDSVLSGIASFDARLNSMVSENGSQE